MQPQIEQVSETLPPNLQEKSPTSSEGTLKTCNLSVEFALKTIFEVFHKDISIRREEKYLELVGPTVNCDNPFRVIKHQFENHHSNPSFDWNLSQSDIMAMPIRDIMNLIPTYDGNEKALDSFIKKIDRLWEHIADFDENDKNQFL